MGAVKQVTVAWHRIDYFEAVLELEDHEKPEDIDGDDQRLVGLEEPAARDVDGNHPYWSTDRVIDSTALQGFEDERASGSVGL